MRLPTTSSRSPNVSEMCRKNYWTSSCPLIELFRILSAAGDPSTLYELRRGTQPPSHLIPFRGATVPTSRNPPKYGWNIPKNKEPLPHEAEGALATGQKKTTTQNSIREIDLSSFSKEWWEERCRWKRRPDRREDRQCGRRQRQCPRSCQA